MRSTTVRIALPDYGTGAANDNRGGIWHYGDKDGTANPNGDWLIIAGVVLHGFGDFPSTITVPRACSHYRGSVGEYMTPPLPPEVAAEGLTRLQVAP